MNRHQILLPMAKPIIHGYTHYAHLLSILQCNQKTLPWIFSNFIQIYMYKDLQKTPWGDFYNPMQYELRLVNTCKWIKCPRVERDQFLENKELLINFLENQLKKGNYLHLNIDHEQITSFKTDKKFHDALVFGIDVDSDIIHVADVFKFGLYEKKVLSISEFINAYYSAEHNIKYDFFDGMIYLYNLRDECEVDFNIKNIENSIIEYRESKTPEYWRLYNTSNKKDVVFGLSAYDSLCQYIECVIKYDDVFLDLRHFYLLMDHKKIMIERLNFLCKQKLYSESSMKFIIKSYQEMSNILKTITHIIIKYDITKNKKILNKVLKYLHQIKNEEYEILGKYLDIAETKNI